MEPALLGSKIRQAREAREWSMAELGRRVGKTHGSVINWEQKGTIPFPNTRRALERAFGWSTGELDPDTETAGSDEIATGRIGEPVHAPIRY